MRLVAVLLSSLAMIAAIPDAEELKRMAARFAPVQLRVDISKLSKDDMRELPKLIDAARVVDHLFLQQLWSGNLKLYADLQKDTSDLGKLRLQYFWLNKGPWSALDEHKAFLPQVPEKKPAGANFYPEDLTKTEFEAWVKTLPPAAQHEATGFFSVVRRDKGKLKLIPYSQEYKADLDRLAGLLREAAAATSNTTLKRFLTTRASAFASNDYYESDVAWMDLDAPIDVTIGPYETYNDELFGYKAAFEAYITIRDDAETDKVKFFSSRLQEIENNLPIDAKYRNPKIGALAPIRVVNELISSGDAAHGVRTAAYNLPNDERVVREKGSKRVMLKNVQEAKFKSTLEPLAARVLEKSAVANLSFDSFFTHILAHELTHGIGPHTVGQSSPRKELKELYSAIEEAKADICGLFMLQYMFDHKLLPVNADTERKLYTTFLASSFRTLRFGTNEAHGKGMALQFNYLSDKGAFTSKDGRFAVYLPIAKTAVRELAHDLLTIEATGDYARAKKLLDEMAIVRPNLKAALDGLKDIPTDINPSPVTADTLAPPHPSR
jgi:Peptidase family M49